MSISSRAISSFNFFVRRQRGRTPNRKIAREAFLAAGFASCTAVLVSAHDPWMAGTAAHPAWIAVLALSGFYGLRGLLIAAPIVWATLGFTAAVLGAGLHGLVERASSGQDVLMAGTALALAAVSMVQARRREGLERALAFLGRQTRTDRDLLEQMRERVVDYRRRADRVEVAIPVWRDVAERLYSGTPSDAAKATLEMCMLRTRARAGIVRRFDGPSMRTLAWAGRWSKDRQVPRDIFPDRTIATAIGSGDPVYATDLPDPSSEDSDVAIPLRLPGGREILGVLALRGALRRNLGEFEVRDVTTLAGWLASAMVARTERGFPAAGEGLPDEPPPPASAPVLRLVDGDGA